jgi:N-6 DNA Methylase
MTTNLNRDPDLEWLDHVQPVGLVVAPSLLKELGLSPLRQSPIDTGAVSELLEPDASKPALPGLWAFVEQILGWEARHVAGAPGGPAIPDELLVALPEHATTLKPTWAVAELGDGEQRWQLLVRVEAAGVDPDACGALDGWEATPHQRFERLLRDTGVFAGLMVTDKRLRLIYAPRGETSGHVTFPIRSLGTVAGRPMLGGLKLLLDRSSLFTAADSHRLPTLLKKSRDAQASVSTALAEQVLGALHELLRGLDSVEPALIRELARTRPDHIYEGLLTVLMRLVFVLYAEDRDLLPSRSDGRAREIYETSYSVRGLYARLVEDAALNPDTMDERRGGWGRLLALFRLIHRGHRTGFVQARGGKLFDPDEFPFLEGQATKDEPARILNVSDGCLLRILEGLMTLKVRGGDRERLSYRTLDVEQIGSVYETVMGFTVEAAPGRVLAIKAGKNNRTPVFVALDELLAKKGKDRIKDLKESAGRGQVSSAQAKAIEAANSADELAAALDSIVDDRGSPRHAIACAGSPILQPTDERRGTGSHYTPRSLTAPIVKHALEPAFERLGENATPEQVLALKVCDPAMGSGAFLVEAGRVIGERLVEAWARWSGTRPAIPADEDEELHARRLVAQRCLYGVDKNARAVDLARLSLWLATLARDHEFTFLDHALKCGDSLVGLTTAQITAANWDESKPGLTLFRQLVKDRVAEALKARSEIQAAPDDTMRAIQEARHRTIEGRLAPIRTMGNAVISAFFAADKPKAREKKRAEVESWLSGSLEGQWEKLDAAASSLRSGEHPIRPFHWEIEFPEVFARENGGFDAVVGNPPFAGKNTIIGGSAKNYLPWLQTLHEGAHGNADLVAHFFRRAYGLLRQGGVFGLIATNTIGQGDTRASGLTAILQNGGTILRATRRLKWPGEAAVVVSVVHVAKGEAISRVLDSRQVRRISAYLVEGDLDTSPAALAANAGKAFVGSYVLGIGFTFDDTAAAKGEAESLDTMRALIAKDRGNAERIFPYIGGEEVNTDPRHAHHRYVIDFFDRPLRRDPNIKPWTEMDDTEIARCRVEGIVPADYLDEVAEDWPDLLEIIRRRVKPERDVQKRDALRVRWWQYAEKRPGLRQAITPLERVLVRSLTSTQFQAFTFLDAGRIYDQTLIVWIADSHKTQALLVSRPHEIWARFLGATFKDDGRYNLADCFRTFPFPEDFETDVTLEAVGEAYHTFRANLMIERNEGLTKTYNRFHARGQNATDIVRLRALHGELDTAVLRAYGWDDLADRAAPEFIEQGSDEGKTPKTRLDWPAAFKDEVLARLLALNAERAAAERAAGLTAMPEDDEDEIDEEAVA